MKNIAITQRLIQNDSYLEVRDALDIKWAKLFKKINCLPIILPSDYDFIFYFKSFKIKGIILSGGNDLSLLSTNELSKKRDHFEKRLIGFGISKGIPILGICRGMQVIADYFNCDFKKVQKHAGTKHKLVVSDKSRFKYNLKKIKTVNSYHNYAINNVSHNLIISARSVDGIIEAIEHKKYNIFGQMWHSEREEPFCQEELKIIKSLFI